VKTADGIVIDAVNHYTSVDLAGTMWRLTTAMWYPQDGHGIYALLSGSWA
jgi:hypothetical protein